MTNLANSATPSACLETTEPAKEYRFGISEEAHGHFYYILNEFAPAKELGWILVDMLPVDSPERRLAEHLMAQHICPGIDELSISLGIEVD